MDKFLKLSKYALTGSSKLIHVVMGNGTCDLDSAMSAVVYSYFLHCTNDKTDSVHHIPVLNLRRVDYELRTDVQHVLNKNGLSDRTLLTFRDEIDLESLCTVGRLRMTLVDCHVLSEPDTSLETCVVEVIDHRPRNRPDRKDVPTTIELVGSCCTLVAEKLLSAKFDIPVDAVNMLFSAIMFDTVCMSESAGRKTPKDETIVSQLQNLQPSLNGQQIFDELKKIKQDDISKLTSTDLLLRDLKVVGSNDFQIAIPAIIGEMQTFLQRPQLETDLINFAVEQKAAAVVLMFLHTVGDRGEIIRELAIFSKNEGLREEIYSKLSEATNSSLCLSRVQSLGLTENIIACNQANVKHSRKVVLPLVQLHIDTFKRFV